MTGMTELELRSAQQINQEEEQQRRQQLVMDDLRAVLAQPQGRRVIHRILQELGFCTTLYRKSADIYAATALHDVATLIMFDISQADPAAYAEILQTEILRRTPGANQ